MRLLNTKTKQLQEFHGLVPQYAILSHTWEADEVLYADFTTSNDHSIRPTQDEKAGWTKINKCCERARRDGWKWVWIDTCCIDKTSSAELSEAINSMFRWYQESSICYTFLSDYPLGKYSERLKFEDSRWFARGWTLQELIAPSFVLFLDQMWVEIGTRTSLSRAIETATGISQSDMQDFRQCSIAKRMSWASKRKTTRLEDEAYSLMGLFDVNMAILYGEGLNAFRRLQIEIMQSSDDDSILAFDEETQFGVSINCLARNPRSFGGSGSVREMSKFLLDTSREVEYRGPRYAMTNIGLSIDLECATITDDKDDRYPRDTIIAKLHSTHGEKGSPIVLALWHLEGIYYRKTQTSVLVSSQDLKSHDMKRRRIILSTDTQRYKDSRRIITLRFESSLQIKAMAPRKFGQLDGYGPVLDFGESLGPFHHLESQNTQLLVILTVMGPANNDDEVEQVSQKLCLSTIRWSDNDVGLKFYPYPSAALLTDFPQLVRLSLPPYHSTTPLTDIAQHVLAEQGPTNSLMDTASYTLANGQGTVIAIARPAPGGLDGGRPPPGSRFKVSIKVKRALNQAAEVSILDM